MYSGQSMIIFSFGCLVKLVKCQPMSLWFSPLSVHDWDNRSNNYVRWSLLIKFTFSWDFGATIFGSQVSGYVLDAIFVFKKVKKKGLNFKALKSHNFLYISVWHTNCTQTCCKAISCRESSVRCLSLKQRRSVSVMEIRSGISQIAQQATLPLELFTLYSGPATVVSVFLLEEEPWHIYVCSKHSSCL